MTAVLRVLISAAALGASGALFAASLGLAWVADILAVTAAGCGLAGFVLTTMFTIRRARRLGRARP